MLELLGRDIACKTADNKLMGKYLVQAIYFILFWVSSINLLGCRGQRNSLTSNSSITEDQALISSGGVYALGFFTPGNSTKNRYVGIWYNSIPEKTVVWVANRENPITNNSGIFKIVADGNIALLDGSGAVIWSTNVSNVPFSNATTATLFDTGNFVLTSGGSDIWQSFDYPTDTLFQGMKLRYNFKTGIAQRAYAWRNSEDPAPGDVYAGFDPDSPLQIVLWRGSEVLWRYGFWKEQTTNTLRNDNSSSILVETIVKNDQEIYYSYAATEQLSLLKLSIYPIGTINTTFWSEDEKKWEIYSYVPRLQCYVYNRCGSFGVCDSTQSTLTCNCLQGFVPRNQKDWNVGNVSGGCVRKIHLSCDGGDQFIKVPELRFPDKSMLLTNLTAEQCNAECLDSCQCTAYAYINISDGVVKDLRCLIWHFELKDIVLDSSLGGDLYVRLSGNETFGKNVGSSRDSKRKNYTVLAVVLLTVIGIVLFATACFVLWRKLKIEGHARTQRHKHVMILGHNNTSNAIESQKDIGVAILDFGTILAATDGFSENHKLGEGGFGPVYKGTLPNGQEIAVKRLSKSSGQGFEEFRNEVELIANLQHRNLVRLLGWCNCADEKILIYEYMSNKSLDRFLFVSKDPVPSESLHWSRRQQIIEGIAQGLLYIHRYSRVRIIHRDLKTSNILLDDEMNPKISDFGLSRIYWGNQTEEARTRRVVGTYGYMSPEYALHGLFSEKSDVFSFGVIMLEIITGKRSTAFYSYKESMSLLGYAWQLWKEGRGLDLVDQSMATPFPAGEVTKCIQVAFLCVQENAADRPTVASVISMLDNENAILPASKQPAFVVGHNIPSSTTGSSHDIISSNELTTSIVHGR